MMDTTQPATETILRLRIGCLLVGLRKLGNKPSISGPPGGVCELADQCAPQCPTTSVQVRRTVSSRATQKTE
jgi:hypothetical protein